MASYKGRNPGSRRRRGVAASSRPRRWRIEYLEDRTLLSSASSTPQAVVNSGPPSWHPTDTNLADAQNGPMANLGQQLVSIYEDYQTYVNSGNTAPYSPAASGYIYFQGNEVGISVSGYGNFSSFVTELQNLGMQVLDTNPSYGIVDGYVPINDLPQVAELNQIIGGEPLYKPEQYYTTYQGAANNEALSTMQTDVASQQFNVDGTGQTVGVISDSVSQYAGGLNDSYKTGDLNSSNPVKVLADGPSGSTDEGRAMLENIHDIAPGANLAFSTAGDSDTSFANSITNLATQANSGIIVDDIRFIDEPFFQPGIIGNAVDQVVTQNNVAYFSAAGNMADEGYLSNWRGVSANVTGVGQGTFMNFDPNGGQTTLLPITVSGNPTAQDPDRVVFQFDQPWYTSSGVSSELNFYILDSKGNIIASGTNDNTATQIPDQIVSFTQTGNFFVAIQLVKGPAPGHVEFYNFSETTDVLINGGNKQPFNGAGVYFPTSVGHSTDANAIGVGAVPWWGLQSNLTPAAPPYLSEPFSSYGPAIQVFNNNGTPLPSPALHQTPQIAAADGGNTSFFYPGEVIDTSNPPNTGTGATGEPPSEPATPTNESQANLPSFFGTSSAAPNAAAVAALMRQLAPQATEQNLLSAMIASATPLNGTPQGTWDPAGGFGLINAPKALNAIAQLRVVSTTPANGANVTSPVGSITFNFNEPVNFSTLSAADLTFSQTPAGVTVSVGAPVQNSSTSVTFPLSFSFPVGTTANGSYAYTLASTSAVPVTSTDGKTLESYSGSFSLNAKTEPTITNVTYSGRQVTIQFSSAMRASTINTSNIYLGVLPSGASQGYIVQPTSLTYNPLTNQAVLDYSSLPQSALPSGTYTLTVTAGVTDVVGNPLNGQYSGVYPSGVANATTGSNFVQTNQFALQPPQITYLSLTEPPLPNPSDTEIPNDNNTSQTQPTFIGQVTTSFPMANAGVTVLAEFNALSPSNVIDLTVGPGSPPRGYSGNFEVTAVTNSKGTFTFYPPSPLTNGVNALRVVAIAAPDISGQAGLSASHDYSFRVDTTRPSIVSAIVGTGGTENLAPGMALPSLSSVTLNVVDPVNGSGPFAVPTNLNFPALDPAAADNISNYALIAAGPDGLFTDGKDYSSYITSAVFNSTTNRKSPTDPFTGQVVLSFAPGLPAGHYELIAYSKQGRATGLVDAGGAWLSSNFSVAFFVQSTPAYIIGLTSTDTYPSQGTTSGNNLMRAYFEESPPAGTPPRDNVPAPPSSIRLDVSNPLLTDAARTSQGLLPYSQAIELLVSPNDDFSGNVTTVPITVTLQNFGGQAGLSLGQFGYDQELIITPNSPLGPGYYRLYLPNRANDGTKIVDQYGNQFDGEDLSNPTGAITSTGQPTSYQDFLPNQGPQANGSLSQSGRISGDGTPGGAFETGFLVVPYGNVIYARPDYTYNPLGGPDYPDGSLAKPFPTLAAEAVSTPINQGNLNSPVNYGSNFNTAFDFNGSGQFEPSAFYAAQSLYAQTRDAVVVVALPGLLELNPLNPSAPPSQKSFVIQAPLGSDGSQSVPAFTMLVFAPGSTLKMLNASLFVQNQGSALQALGGPNSAQQVNFTSYNDTSVAAATNSGSAQPARPGDWGGIVFRNYNDTNQPDPTTAIGPLDPNLGGKLGTSGADNALSIINNSHINYAGGAVPATIGYRFDAITLFNSRPAISNNFISNTGGIGTLQAGISADVDSLTRDDLSWGPTIRANLLVGNGLNGIWIRPNLNGIAEATTATPGNILQNPAEVLFSDLAYVLTSEMVVGEKTDASGNLLSNPGERLYIQPGMLVKSTHGGGIDVTSIASIVIGDRTYMDNFDANAAYAPVTSTGSPNANFRPPQEAPYVIFTSLFDDSAKTVYVNPVTGVATPIVPANGSVGTLTNPATPSPGDWGSLLIASPARATINDATFEYGGGQMNVPGGTGRNDVLAFSGTGAFVYATNNNFYNNQGGAMSIDPNGLLAGDPLRPLASGNPFLHGNVMSNNGIDGLEVNAGLPLLDNANLTVNSVWDLTDITYVLQGTIVLGPQASFGAPPNPTPSPNKAGNIPTPNVTLTIQSQLPGTLLANGQSISAPGASVVVKLRNPGGAAPPSTPTGTPGYSGINWNAGAGFEVGVDNGIDPPRDPLVDPGVDSSIRIVGVAGDESTHQQRVPAIITSLYDNSVGPTVRGVDMRQALPGNSTAPAAGDGGNIIFGANSLSSYNLQDPRQGNLIQNADIRYITSIDVQGGGLVQVYDTNGDKSFTAADFPMEQKTGAPLPIFGPGTTSNSFLNQYNVPKSLPILNSNLANFSQVGVVAYDSGFGMIAQDVGPLGGINPLNFTTNPARVSVPGEPTNLLMINDTVANTPIGVNIISQTGTNEGGTGTGVSPSTAVFLNNTFYNDTIGIQTTAPAFSPGPPPNTYAHVEFLAMDNIFDGSTASGVNSGSTPGPSGAVIVNGQAYGSQLQYNLFFNDSSQVTLNNVSGWFGNNFPFTGDPMFVNAQAGNFNLQQGSAAIDRSRSEIGPIWVGAALEPYAAQALNGTGGQILIARYDVGTQGGYPAYVGQSPPSSQDLVTLPGYPLRTYIDNWMPALPNSPGAVPGPATNVATTWWVPMSTVSGQSGNTGGERDQNGNLRQKDPGSNNVGFGSRPYFDIGAFEYRQFFAPQVTNVTATVTSPGSSTTSTIPLYKVDGIGGTNLTIQTIQVSFSLPLDPNTINGQTVELEASGGTGQFNGNPQDTFINLSGKLSFDPTTDILTINLGPNGLPTDAYRLILVGTGAQVLRDKQGDALDGENLDANGNQRALPSGDGTPGGNFQMTFTVIATGSSIVPGSVILAPQSDSNKRDGITNVTMPSFTGKITDVSPNISPLGGQTVILDISSQGNGNYDLLDVGSAITNPDGTFTVTAGKTVPNSPYVVGADGVLDPLYTGNANGTITVNPNFSTTGYSWAQVRVIDSAGNFSPANPPGNPYGNKTAFIEDAAPPQIVATSPGFGSTVNVSGQSTLTISFTTNKTIDPSSLSSSSLVVTGSGGTGSFGNSSNVNIPINASSITVTPNHTPQGGETISFTIPTASLTNDVYQATFKGAGSSAIKDIAGTALAGFNGQAGTDYNLRFVVNNPNVAAKLIFVNASSTATGTPDGTYAKPYTTIQAAINAAKVGNIVAVLPGVYNENITLAPEVRVLSADPSSSDTNFVPGNPLRTVIRGTSGTTPTVSATNLTGFPGLPTEISGFSIATPLVGDPATGSINPNSTDVQLVNSSVLVDKNFLIDSANGVGIYEVGTGPASPQVVDNAILGNIVGINLGDQGISGFFQAVPILQNTIAFNTYGIYINGSSSSPALADIANNIFYQNHDLTANRFGAAIAAGVPLSVPGMVQVQNNLFSGNGPSDSSPADDTSNIVGGFNPGALGTSPDANGNYVGSPAFANPRDPRPTSMGGDGPGDFFFEGNFDLTAGSAAIGGANGGIDTTFDSNYLINTLATDLANRPRNLSGRVDVGAFQYQGTTTTAGTSTRTGSTPTFPTTYPITTPTSGSPGTGSFLLGAAAPAVTTTTPTSSPTTTTPSPAVTTTAPTSSPTPTAVTTTTTTPSATATPALTTTTTAQPSPAPASSSGTVIVTGTPAPAPAPVSNFAAVNYGRLAGFGTARLGGGFGRTAFSLPAQLSSRFRQPVVLPGGSPFAGRTIFFTGARRLR